MERGEHMHGCKMASLNEPCSQSTAQAVKPSLAAFHFLRFGMVASGKPCFGGVRFGQVWCSMDRQGEQRSGAVWCGWVMSAMARFSPVGQGPGRKTGMDRYGHVWLGRPGIGQVGSDPVWFALRRRSMLRSGLVRGRNARYGTACCCLESMASVMCGEVRSGWVPSGSAVLGLERNGVERLAEVRR